MPGNSRACSEGKGQKAKGQTTAVQSFFLFPSSPPDAPRTECTGYHTSPCADLPRPSDAFSPKGAKQVSPGRSPGFGQTNEPSPEGARQKRECSAPRAESLPRSRIIRRRAVFDTARNKGRRVSSRHFILNFIARDALASGETGSVAFLTPKRLGPATVRNRLRRRMREIHRRDLVRPDEKAYLIWIARPPALELSFEDLKRAMRDLRERMRS